MIVQASYASPPLAAQQVSYSFSMDLLDDETDDPDQYTGLYGSFVKRVAAIQGIVIEDVEEKYKIIANVPPQFKNDTQYFYTFQ